MEKEVSIDKRGIDIFSWAAGYFRGSREVDLYCEKNLMGIKPVKKGQRKLSPKTGSRGFFVACTPLMREIGVSKKRRVPAEWDEKRKILIVDLKGSKR